MGDYVATVEEPRPTDAGRAGGKGGDLGELVAAKLPVPPGFVVLSATYREVVQAGPRGTEHALSMRSVR
ncbi:PEP/pyruvate-binding domain-containing protein [Nocardia sp. NPDC056611]|uniref:PEP/pyruvate-binding domain-containing protein n=1 Tax=Nocardia sp. NPDC056611 TaxID=3345877 RepID=UPI00366C214D